MFFSSFYRLIGDHPCTFSVLASFLLPVLVLLVFFFRCAANATKAAYQQNAFCSVLQRFLSNF